MANKEEKVIIKADNKQFLSALAVCGKKLAELARSSANIKMKEPRPVRVTVDDAALKSGVKNAENTLGGLSRQTVQIKVDAAQARPAVKQAADAVKSVADQKIKLTLDHAGAAEGLKKTADKIRSLFSVKLRIPLAQQPAAPTPSRAADLPDGAGVESLSAKLTKMGEVTAKAYAAFSILGGNIAQVVSPIVAYSSALEQNQVVVETFLGSSELARQYLDELRKIAAETSFDLPGVTDAGKKLLAFGFGAEQSLAMLRTIGDAAAGLGMGSEGIDRITLALGEMKANGEVSEAELLRLTEAGIPAYTILAEKLGLNAEQIENIGASGISANEAIAALLEGMDEKFGGSAERVSNTMQGMVSTINTNFAAIGSTLLAPLYEQLKESLEVVRNWSADVAEAIRSGDGSAALKEMFTPLIPPELQGGIEEIVADYGKLKSTMAGIFEGGEGAGGQILGGIADGVLDCVDDCMEVLNLIGKIGNTLLWVVNQILPEGSAQFKSLRDLIAFCVKTLLEFFILRKVKVLLEGVVGAFRLVGGGVKSVGAVVKNLIGWFGKLITMITQGFKSGQSAGTVFKNVLSEVWRQIKDLAKHPWKITLLFSASASAVKPNDASEKNGIDPAREKNDQSNREQQNESDEEPPLDQGPPPKQEPLPDADGTAVYAAARITLDEFKKMLSFQRDNALIDIEQTRNEVEQTHKANPNGDQRAYYARLAQIDLDKIGIELSIAERIRAKVEATPFERAEDKQAELNGLDLEIKKLNIAFKNAALDVEQLGKAFTSGGDAIFTAAEDFLGMRYIMGGSGDWASGTDCGKLTMDAYKAAGLTLTRRTADAQLAQMEDAGGFHNDRSKLKRGDLVFYDTKYMPVSNDRAALDADDRAYKANHVGIYQGKGKILHAGSSTGVAENIDMDFAQVVGFGDFTSIVGTAERQSMRATQEKASKFTEYIANLIKEGEKIMREAAETTGDASARQIAELSEQYDQTIKKFEQNHMPRQYIDAAIKLRDYKTAGIEFDQIKKKMQTAYEDAAREQKESLNSTVAGSTDVLDAANKAAKDYLTAVSEERDKLKAMLEKARANGWKDWAKEIENKLDDIGKNVRDIYKASLESLEEDLKRRLALIESNPKLTKFQKEEQSDDARREYLQKKINAKQDERNREFNDENNNIVKIAELDFDISELENQLKQLTPIIDRIGQASKQAFEDGLFDFLSRGINECQSLGEAFRSMATSILEDIQRMSAKILTTNIMNALYPPDVPKNPPNDPKIPSKDSNISGSGKERTAVMQEPLCPDGSFADGGSIVEDQIQGPGTGVSDSILAWVGSARKFIRVSDGEWIMKQKAVNYYGPNIMSAINRGLIPRKILDAHAKYAEGGSTRGLLPSAGMDGPYGLTAEMANSFSPKVYNDIRVDANGLAGGVQKMIDATVKTRVEKEIIQNAKRYDMIMGLTRRR